MSLSKRLQFADPRALPPASVSHLVFSQPGESFLAVEISDGRFPVAKIRFVDEVIAWNRSDGASEYLDLSGCAALKDLQKAFESEGGLMLLMYSSLVVANHDSSPADVTFLMPRAAARRAEVSRA